MPRPATRRPSTSPTRASGSASRTRSEREPAEARKGGLSKLDGFLIGGGAIVGVAIAAVLLMGGKSEAGSGGAAPASSSSSPPPAASAPATDSPKAPEPAPTRALPKTDEETARDLRVEYLRKAAAAETSANLLQLADWCDKKGLADEAKKQLTRATLRNPETREARLAHGKLGHKKFEAPVDLSVPELVPYIDRYLTPSEMADAQKIVEAAREKARLVAEEEAKDPWLKNARRIARTNLLDPAMKNFHLTVSYHRPYVVFVESDVELKNGGVLATGEAIPVADLSPSLQTVHAEHGAALAANLEHYVAKYGNLVHNYKPESDVFLFFSFQNRKSFDAYQVHRDKGAKPESFLRAYYIPATREVISFLRETDGGPMTTPVHVVCHEAIHQLTHHFEKGSVAGRPDTSNPGAYWFQEGFAEYLSPSSDRFGTDPATGKNTYDFCGILKMRLVEYAGNKSAGLCLPIDKLIRDDQPQAISDIFDLMKNSTLTNEQKKEIASVGFYGQAWFFTHFLNHYQPAGAKEPKYKEAFDKQVANELNAESRPVDFIRFLGITKWTDKDKFDALQAEMDEYLETVKKQM